MAGQVLLLLAAALLASANASHMDADILQSLKANVIGCKVRQVLVNNTIPLANSADEVVVRPIFPSAHEVSIFQRFPVSLTRANKEIGALAGKVGLTEDKWGSESTSRQEIPSDHIGQNRKVCINMTMVAATEKLINFYEAYKHTQRGFYVMNARNALILSSGSVGLPCGYFVGSEACDIKSTEVADWFGRCQADLKAANFAWDKFWEKGTGAASSAELQAMASKCLSSSPSSSSSSSVSDRQGKEPVKWYPKVFTISAAQDDSYHHFLTDSLVRLSRNLRFLKHNPDVYIHIRAQEQTQPSQANLEYRQRAEKMRGDFFDLLGINRSRIVSGPVFAEQVFIPRAMKCSTLLSNPAELRLMNKQLTLAASWYLAHHPSLHATVNSELGASIASPQLRDVQRHSPQGYQLAKAYNSAIREDPLPSTTANPRRVLAHSNHRASSMTSLSHKVGSARTHRIVVYQQHVSGRSTPREWSDATVASLTQALSQSLPDYHSQTLSSLSTESSQSCLACDIVRYRTADVLIAAHSTGLTNMIFLRPGSIVVEVVGSMAAVSMPVCGYFGPMAAGLGLHHYIYAYDHAASGEGLPVADLSAKVATFLHTLDRMNNGTTEAVVKVHIPAGHSL